MTMKMWHSSLRMLLLLDVILCILVFAIPTLQSSTPMSLIFKDKSTKLFMLSVSLKTPLQPTKLYLDLAFEFPWILCDTNYNSSNFRTIACNFDSLCHIFKFEFGPLVCSNCNTVVPHLPNNCIFGDLVCAAHPKNPVTGTSGTENTAVDTLALHPTTKGAPLIELPNFAFSCANSSLLKGLPKHTKGLVTLAESRFSMASQITSNFGTTRTFALCLPASPKIPGVAFFSSFGPYLATSSISSSFSEIDLADLLIYTPLMRTTSETPFTKHLIGVTSIRINSHPVPIDASLLNIDLENGFGSTTFSTATPYTLLESSIYKSFIELFLKETSSPAFNLTTVATPLKPFKVCYNAVDIALTRVGPRVPDIDLVLHAPEIIWRMRGANSMVRVANKKKGVDLWCLGFMDGGLNKMTPVVIGGKQLEDTLIQFDVESNRFGFTSSLLGRSLSCPDLNVAHII